MSDRKVLQDVYDEMIRQSILWGEQNHADGTSRRNTYNAETAKRLCDDAFEKGLGTWAHILSEEVFEAMAEEDPDKLRVELIQIAAVATSWAEAIDRKKNL